MKDRLYIEHGNAKFLFLLIKHNLKKTHQHINKESFLIRVPALYIFFLYTFAKHKIKWTLFKNYLKEINFYTHINNFLTSNNPLEYVETFNNAFDNLFLKLEIKYDNLDIENFIKLTIKYFVNNEGGVQIKKRYDKLGTNLDDLIESINKNQVILLQLNKAIIKCLPAKSNNVIVVLNRLSKSYFKK